MFLSEISRKKDYLLCSRKQATSNILKPVFIIGVFSKIFIYVIFLYLFQFGIYLKCKFLPNSQKFRIYLEKITHYFT